MFERKDDKNYNGLSVVRPMTLQAQGQNAEAHFDKGLTVRFDGHQSQMMSEPLSSAARHGRPKRTSQASGSSLSPIENEGDCHGPPRDGADSCRPDTTRLAG